MYGPLEGILAQRLNDVRASGLFKQERLIDSAQGTRVRLKDGREVLNLCANNYLGLADHPKVKAAATAALARWGYGVASVRFICGTFECHHTLEAKIAEPTMKARRRPNRSASLPPVTISTPKVSA